MLKRFSVSLSLSLACALLLAACGGSDSTTNSSNTTTGNKTTTTTTTTTSTPATTSTPTTTSTTTTTTAAGDKIGVPECDDFITKYEACVSGKVPEAQRAMFNTSIKQWRDAWQKAAATPQGKSTLTQLCKTTAEQSRASMKAFGCDF